MAFSSRGTQPLQELFDDVLEAPDFSFLNDWSPSYDSSFFPKLNSGADGNAKLKLKRVERRLLKLIIPEARKLSELLDDTVAEISESKGYFSNSISVFHRNGEPNIIAIPVTRKTEKSMGGFLLAQELKELPHAEKFIEEVKGLQELIPNTQDFLKFKHWFSKKEIRTLNRRTASQLFLSGSEQSERNIFYISEILQDRLDLTSGQRKPEEGEWLQAILHLESLKSFPKESVINVLDLETMDTLYKALELYRRGFARRDEALDKAKEAAQVIAREKVKATLDSITVSDFATKVKGQGFGKKALINLYDWYMTKKEDPTLGDILRLFKNNPEAFNTATLQNSVSLIDVFAKDQEKLAKVPNINETGAAADRFFEAIYVLQKEQGLPYPARAQFESLDKLLEGSPNALRLIGRSEKDITRLIGSVDSYTDSTRVSTIQTHLAAHEDMSLLAAKAREFFKENPASYQSVVSSLGFNTLSLEQIAGFLAPELTKTIKAIEVDSTGLNATLRSYQEFGVQYALSQKRIVLGDEMGLGKTLTALGLAKHLSNEGAEKILAIVPLAVLENWRREIAKHTDYKTHVLYGDALEDNFNTWIDSKQIALTTYESVQKINKFANAGKIKNLDLVIIDEAHYLKNPETLRARGVIPWLNSSEHAMLMTGTPLENKLDEFKQLIRYVQPKLEFPANALAYSSFRKAIAPAYLRRNQADVLSELPEKSDVKEYTTLSKADMEYYKRALENSDWHALRRAKVLAGEKSNTVKQIQSIVDDAMSNNNKVIIFSYYLDTIAVLQRVLKDDDEFTPLTGELNSIERQNEVDKFTASKKPGVLLAQINSGGTGLNIQAASVVILVEPQTKPSLEEQAIARAFRMGQTKQVQIFRMRATGTIDERWDNMLDEKKKIFSATAGVSDAAALDIAVEGTSSSLLADEKKAWGL